MPAPNPGEIVYLGPNQENPHVVMRVQGTYVTSVPLDTAFHGTHQGNLYNASSDQEWRVHGE